MHPGRRDSRTCSPVEGAAMRVHDSKAARGPPLERMPFRFVAHEPVCSSVAPHRYATSSCVHASSTRDSAHHVPREKQAAPAPAARGGPSCRQRTELSCAHASSTTKLQTSMMSSSEKPAVHSSIWGATAALCSCRKTGSRLQTVYRSGPWPAAPACQARAAGLAGPALARQRPTAPGPRCPQYPAAAGAAACRTPAKGCGAPLQGDCVCHVVFICAAADPKPEAELQVGPAPTPSWQSRSRRLVRAIKGPSAQTWRSTSTFSAALVTCIGRGGTGVCMKASDRCIRP